MFQRNISINGHLYKTTNSISRIILPLQKVCLCYEFLLYLIQVHSFNGHLLTINTASIVTSTKAATAALAVCIWEPIATVVLGVVIDKHIHTGVIFTRLVAFSDRLFVTLRLLGCPFYEKTVITFCLFFD